jgi:type VI secretion system protein ImpJ
MQSLEVRNNASTMREPVEIETARLNMTLRLGSEDLNGYAVIGCCQVVEKVADKPVELEYRYIPPLVDCNGSPHLVNMLTELHGLLKTRGDELGLRLTDSGRAATADVADYLLLQCINRLEPLCGHYKSIQGLHPLEFFTELLKITGELCTHTRRERRPPELPLYRHDDLLGCFGGVFSVLRLCLSEVIPDTAISFNLVPSQEPGYHYAQVGDKRNLLARSTFVLAVKADVQQESLRQLFPVQAKVAPVENIQGIVAGNLPGIPLSPMSYPPPEIRVLAGFNYFLLNREGAQWQAMAESAAFGIHVGAEFPGLEMELWAIQEAD